MASEPDWLDVEEIIELNAEIVADTKEPHLVRDPGLLEIAQAKPINFFWYGEQDVVVLAVALMLGIARNHPFEQGNKRTAFEASRAFLYMNGYDLVVPDTEEFADIMIDVIIGNMSEHAFTELLYAYVVEIP